MKNMALISLLRVLNQKHFGKYSLKQQLSVQFFQAVKQNIFDKVFDLFLFSDEKINISTNILIEHLCNTNRLLRIIPIE